MAIPQSKNLYEPRSTAHFEAVEQTCRLRQLLESEGKYFFPVSGVDQGHSIVALDHNRHLRPLAAPVQKNS